ncbi:hypothetical protein HZC07_00780 [Candidatus Micrarchaeota archaeon]|nr:hypothetical protein [Candidatus Micrarchaeota archaeon]
MPNLSEIEDPLQVEVITPENIGDVEKETLKRVNKTISTLENAIESWNALKQKPKTLEQKFIKHKQFYEQLAKWETKTLKDMRKKDDFDSRIHGLQDFVNICYAYS